MKIQAEIMKGDAAVYNGLDRYNSNWPSWGIYTFENPTAYCGTIKKLSNENEYISIKNVKYID